jgi:iron complex transport system ATP-binding protein
MNAIIEARAASFTIRGKALVHDATLALQQGQITVIIGPNGAGKSTLLKLLTGELQPTCGTVLSLGVPLTSIPVWRLACRRAVMAQGAGVLFPFAVHEVARIGLDGVGRSLSEARKSRIVEETLASADVLHLADRTFQSLSGGEQQRVQFARVLCQLKAGATVEQHQALFLDEPIASLDLRHQLALLDTARKVADSGVAVLAILHDLNLAATYADHLVVLSNTAIVAGGYPSEVITQSMLAEVFGVHLPITPMPGSGLPSVLPQHHCASAIPMAAA